MTDNKGLVGGIVAGIGALILTVIVILVIVSTMTNANLLRSTASTTTVGRSVETGAWLNNSGYTLSAFNSSNRDYAIVSIYNATGIQVTSANWTFDSSTGIIKNSTSAIDRYGNVNISYTYTPLTSYEVTTNDFGNRFMSGINNVSTKIPTILLIAAIVLLMGVLVLLIRKAQESGFGGFGQSEGSL